MPLLSLKISQLPGSLASAGASKGHHTDTEMAQHTDTSDVEDAIAGSPIHDEDLLIGGPSKPKETNESKENKAEEQEPKEHELDGPSPLT